MVEYIKSVPVEHGMLLGIYIGLTVFFFNTLLSLICSIGLDDHLYFVDLIC